MKKKWKPEIKFRAENLDDLDLTPINFELEEEKLKTRLIFMKKNEIKRTRDASSNNRRLI